MQPARFVPGPPVLQPERGIFSLGELTSETVHRLARRACDFYDDPDAGGRPLHGRTVGVLFTRTSTRTRTAFTAGAIKLGGAPVTFGPDDLQTNTGESLTDTGRVLGSMLDLLVARTAGPLAELRTLSGSGGIPVVNAMATEEHPTQGICDLATISLVRGGLEGVNVLYLGEGNNTATALAQGLSHVPGCRVVFATPRGYGLPAQVLEETAARAAEHGAEVVETHSLDELPDRVDFVYTTRWQTTGTSKGDAHWREAFRPFHVDDALMNRWPDAWFLHDLPAHRGDEVAAGVLDGERSVAWLQARMKLTSAMAALEWAVGTT